MTKASNDQQELPSQLQNDEIDLRLVTGALCRRWILIASGGALGVVFSGLYLLTTKPVYQGEFQIVLSQKKSQSGAAALLSQNPALAALAGLSSAGGDDSIATEVQILKSPSVLRPVFDAVKALKPPGIANKMRFQQWAQSAVTAQEEQGTSVLKVEFRDTDQKLVLPITKMLSRTYQSYSNRGRTRELDNVITYLRAQIRNIKPKAEGFRS